MSFDLREWQVAPGNWNRLNEILGLLGVQEVPSLKVTGGGVIDRDTDVTSDTFGELTLNYDAIQFDESPAGTFHIQHFHTEDTKRTCAGVDTEDGSGQSDTLVGHDVGSGSVVGWNTLVGAECGKTITDGFANTGVGCLTFSAVDGNVARNTALGYHNQLNLLSRNNYTSACGNTSMGAFCCQNLVTGMWNSGIGYYALKANKYGHGNFGVGAHTFEFLNSTERVITAFADAGGGQVTVTTTTTNLSNGDSVRITATDNYDGEYVIANVTGTTFEITETFTEDDAVGYVTLETEGCYNVGIGLAAGHFTTIGGRNVFIGSRSGYSNVTGSSNVYIGYQAGYNEAGSNKLYIENSNSASPLIYGEFDNDIVRINGKLEALTTSAPQLKLSYDGSNYTTWTVGSSGNLLVVTSGSYLTFSSGTSIILDIGDNELYWDGDELYSAVGSKNLGKSANKWGNLYLSDSAYIDGDVTCDQIVAQGNMIIDVTHGEALNIRKNTDGGDIFIVDTIGGRVGINKIPSVALDIIGALTTSDLATFPNLDVDTLNLNGNVISDSTGTISFDNDDMVTTGVGTFGNLIVDTHTLITDSTNDRVAINGLTPQRKLHINSDVSGSKRAVIRFSDMQAANDTEVVSWFEWYRGNNTKRVGFFGYGQSGDLDFDIWNEIGNLNFGAGNTYNGTDFKWSINGTTGALAANGAYDVTTSGNVIFALAGIPAADPSVAGQLWRDGTDLKISLG